MGVGAGSDFDSAGSGGRCGELFDRPACGVFDPAADGQAANTMARWASIESRWWGDRSVGLAGRVWASESTFDLGPAGG